MELAIIALISVCFAQFVIWRNHESNKAEAFDRERRESYARWISCYYEWMEAEYQSSQTFVGWRSLTPDPDNEIDVRRHSELLDKVREYSEQGVVARRKAMEVKATISMLENDPAIMALLNSIPDNHGVIDEDSAEDPEGCVERIGTFNSFQRRRCNELLELIKQKRFHIGFWRTHGMLVMFVLMLIITTISNIYITSRGEKPKAPIEANLNIVTTNGNLKIQIVP